MPPLAHALDSSYLKQWLLNSLDIGLVFLLAYSVLLILKEPRTLWLVRGLSVLMIFLVFAEVLSFKVGLNRLSFLLDKLTFGTAVATVVIFQSELRRFLENLGRGEIKQLFRPPKNTSATTDKVIDQIVEAVKELSSNRTGALIVLETNANHVNEGDFKDPGVLIDAQVSKELILSIFQTTTILHDGAVVIGGSKLISASTLLPISDRAAPRQLGTRHRAALGLTERVADCLCIIVSEETGSISLAERGNLNRPLTATKLKELLEAKFSPTVERETPTTNLGKLNPNLGSWRESILKSLFSFLSSNSQEKK